MRARRWSGVPARPSRALLQSPAPQQPSRALGRLLRAPPLPVDSNVPRPFSTPPPLPGNSAGAAPPQPGLHALSQNRPLDNRRCRARTRLQEVPDPAESPYYDPPNPFHAVPTRDTSRHAPGTLPPNSGLVSPPDRDLRRPVACGQASPKPRHALRKRMGPGVKFSTPPRDPPRLFRFHPTLDTQLHAKCTPWRRWLAERLHDRNPEWRAGNHPSDPRRSRDPDKHRRNRT